jgi:hypothetical protein
VTRHEPQMERGKNEQKKMRWEGVYSEVNEKWREMN